MHCPRYVLDLAQLCFMCGDSPRLARQVSGRFSSARAFHGHSVARRNALMDRSGFSPDQRAFGRGLRLAGCLLSDDRVDSDLLNAQADDDVWRAWEIRDAAGRA